MARTPNHTEVTEHIVTDADTPSLQERRDDADQLAKADMVTLSNEEALIMIGRIETADFVRRVGEKIIAETVLNLKNGKKYKGLPYLDENKNVRHVGTFEEFCKYKLRKSVSRVHEYISNYKLLGAELYEQAERIGFGQRDYNALKALPEDDRKIIAEAIEAEDLDKALHFMGQMAAKHQSEKEAAQKQQADLQEAIEVKDDMLKDKTEKINTLDEQITKLRRDNLKQLAEDPELPERELMEKFQRQTNQLVAAVDVGLRSQIVQFTEFYQGDTPQHIRLMQSQALGLVVAAAYQLAEEMALTVEVDSEDAVNYTAQQEGAMLDAMMAESDTEH